MYACLLTLSSATPTLTGYGSAFWTATRRRTAPSWRGPTLPVPHSPPCSHIKLLCCSSRPPHSHRLWVRVVDRHQKKAERVGVAPPAPPHADRGKSQGAMARLLGRGRKAKEGGGGKATGGRGAARAASVGSGGSVLARGVLPLSDAVTTLLQVGRGGDKVLDSRGGGSSNSGTVRRERGGAGVDRQDGQGASGPGVRLPLSDAVTTLLQVGCGECGVCGVLTGRDGEGPRGAGGLASRGALTTLLRMRWGVPTANAASCRPSCAA